MGRNGLLLTQLLTDVAPNTRRRVETVVLIGVVIMGIVAYNL